MVDDSGRPEGGGGEQGRPEAWYQLSLLGQEEQGSVLEMYLGGTPAGQIAEFCRKKRANAAASVKLSRIKAELPSGVCIVASGQGLTLDDLIESLGEAQREAKKARDQGLDARHVPGGSPGQGQEGVKR